MSKRINVTVSDSIHEELKQISEDYGMPISSLGSISIMTWLNLQHGRKDEIFVDKLLELERGKK